MRTGRLVIVLGLVLLIALALSLTMGAASLSLRDVWEGLVAQRPSAATSIVWQLRVPRAVLGALVGVCLSVSGVTLQAVLRNPLAEPYLLGVSGGAAVGAVVVSSLGLISAVALSIGAFVGAIGAVALVLLLARTSGAARDTRILLMAGVVVGAFASAVIMVLLSRVSPTARGNAMWWMMGSVAYGRWSDVLVLAVAATVGAGWMMHRARDLDILTLGAESAAALGVHPERTGTRLFVVASLLAAASVAVAGLIGFVGLVVPHAARAIVKNGSTRRVLVTAAFLGAALVMIADVAARTMLAPIELPLGAITAIVGVPFFLLRLRALQ